MIAGLQKPLIQFITSSRGFSELSASLSEAFKAYPALSLFLSFALTALLLSVVAYVFLAMVGDWAKDGLSGILPSRGWWQTLGVFTAVYCVTFIGGGMYSAHTKASSDFVSSHSGQILTSSQLEEHALRNLVVVETYDKNDRKLGTGSGFFFKQNNLIVTNEHVVGDGAWVLVRKPNLSRRGFWGPSSEREEESYLAKILYSNAERDIALLQVNYHNDTFLVEGSPDALWIGEEVFAAGNPAGKEGVFSSGVFLDHHHSKSLKYMKITAPLAPGSSGSAVFNNKGEVVGVATAISGDGTKQIGIAMPITYALSAIKFHRESLRWVSVTPSELRP